MYYKLYRRRKYIYAGLLIFGILILIYKLNSLNTGKQNVAFNNRLETNIDSAIQKKELKRVNIKTYAEPELCLGCPGENGAPVFLNKVESDGIEEMYNKEFFNLKASEKISLWRTIPDMRSSE
jgi:hypothetical protein